MKFLFILTILTSFSCFAETSCLKLTPKNSKVLLMCDVSDKGGSNFYSYYNLKSCFIGSATEVVTKINDTIFRDSDEGLIDAVVVNEDVITFTYYNLSTTIDHIVKRCE